MIVVVAASSRHYDAARDLTSRLLAEGLSVLTPHFDYCEVEVEVDAATKQRLTVEFLAKIQRADLLYVVAPDGYIGISVALEVGFAHGLSKPILLSTYTGDSAVNGIASGVVPLAELSRQTLEEFRR